MSKIKNINHPSVCGIGYIGVGDYKIAINGKQTLHYKYWVSLLTRCYDETYRATYLTYKDITVCEEWKCFQIFAQWFEENCIEKFHLDKDILFKGNKIYSPETCAFVPQEINNLFTRNNIRRGALPIGVSKSGSKFRGQLTKNKERVYLGTFDSVEEAFQAYKTAKEVYIKEMADLWRGQITEPTYYAMYNYQVEIMD